MATEWTHMFSTLKTTVFGVRVSSLGNIVYKLPQYSGLGLRRAESCLKERFELEDLKLRIASGLRTQA